MGSEGYRVSAANVVIVAKKHILVFANFRSGAALHGARNILPCLIVLAVNLINVGMRNKK